MLTVNRRDYTVPQLEAWAPAHMDTAAWNRSFAAHFTLVATDGKLLVGFGDIDARSHIDRLFVHKDYQRRGVGSAICTALEARAIHGRVTADVSITALPFFLQRGYGILRRQQVLRRGVLLDNFAMEKRPPAPPVAPPQKPTPD